MRRRINALAHDLGLALLRLGLLLPAVVFSSGCSVKPDYRAATDACGLFHRQVDRGEYGPIYDNAVPAFQASLDRERLVAFLGRIARKMGKCDEATLGFAGYQFTTSGTFVTTTARRVCANGSLSEQFVWLMVGSKAKLVKYNANSPLLLTD
jgi:hypothetical protein